MGPFQAAANFDTVPNSLVVGDFNGDGKADLAVAHLGDYASVLLGNGDGTFQTQVAYKSGRNPFSISVGDFNGDGKTDLALANYNGNNVSVLLGNGDGTFQAVIDYNAGNNPFSVAVGDFNGDGKADLTVVNAGSNNVSVLLGNGNGTFQTAVNYNAGSGPASVAVGDFNGDGKADLTVVNAGSNNVSVLLGNGDGTFQAAVFYSVGTLPRFVAVGDFNGDGRADLAVANESSNNVSILLGVAVQVAPGNPSFTAASVTSSASFVSGATPGSIITIFGTNLSNVTGIAQGGILPLTRSIQGTSVTVGGTAAPLFAVVNQSGSEQINLQVPYEVTGQSSVPFVVNSNGRTNAPVTVPILAAQPGVFAYDPDNKGIILHGADNSLITPSSPAAKGEVVVIYATGLGPVSPAQTTGAPAGSGANLANTSTLPVITVGGSSAVVQFSGLTPGLVGLYQINLVVPANAVSGSLDVIVTIIGQSSKAVKLSVK